MLLKRIGVAVIFLPLILYFILTENALWWAAFVYLLSTAASLEFVGFLKLKKIKINKVYLLFSSLLLSSSFYLATISKSFVFLPYLVFIVLNFLYFVKNIFIKNFENGLVLTSFHLLLIFYAQFLVGHLILLKSKGSYFLLFVISLAWLNDTFAYFIGSIFGRKKLNLKVSPNKSYAGTVAGIVIPIFFLYGMNTLYKKNLTFKLLFLNYKFKSDFIFDLKMTILICVLFGLVVILSDLIESLFKRSAGVKDSSNFIPGHGGVLDVFDSVIFSAPIFYYFVSIFIK